MIPQPTSFSLSIEAGVCTITLDREKSLGDIRIYYPGFQPVVFNRYKSFNWWTVGSFVLVALIVPVIVDFVTGNYMRFEDDEITISLTQLLRGITTLKSSALATFAAPSP